LLEEHRRAAIAPLRDMMREAGDDQASKARYATEKVISPVRTVEPREQIVARPIPNRSARLRMKMTGQQSN